MNRSTAYFNTYFTDFYASNPAVAFLGFDANNDFNLYGPNARIPAPRFNIYMNFDVATFTFAANSTPPDAIETMTNLRDSISADFILSTVRTDGTPFNLANEVVLAASRFTQPP